METYSLYKGSVAYRYFVLFICLNLQPKSRKLLQETTENIRKSLPENIL